MDSTAVLSVDLQQTVIVPVAVGLDARTEVFHGRAMIVDDMEPIQQPH